MKKCTVITGISVMLFALLLSTTFLLPVAKAQSTATTPMTEYICDAWLSDQIQTVDGLIRLITIVQTADTYQSNPNDTCEVWFHNSSKSLFGIFILIEAIERLTS